MAAPFVFSYAHNDALDDAYRDFFEELNKRVRYVTGTRQDGFIDEWGLRAGDVWSDALVAELRTARSIVCLYSPSYFSSEVCSQELQVFLERRRMHQLQHVGHAPSAIIPVLWQPTPVPWSLPDFQFERPRAKDVASHGVWHLRDIRRNKEFNSIAQNVAVRVSQALRSPQLMDLGFAPALGGVASAFDAAPLPPLDFTSAGQGANPSCATFVYPDGRTWSDWLFAPSAQPILRIAAAVAKGRDLDARQLVFNHTSTDFMRQVQSARNRNNLVVLLVDGTMLAEPLLVARLREFDEECARQDSPGVSAAVVAWPFGTAQSDESKRRLREAFPLLSVRRQPTFHGAVEDHDQFANAVGRSLDVLRTAIRANPGDAPTFPPTTAFPTLPILDASNRQQAA